MNGQPPAVTPCLAQRGDCRRRGVGWGRLPLASRLRGRPKAQLTKTTFLIGRGCYVDAAQQFGAVPDGAPQHLEAERDGAQARECSAIHHLGTDVEPREHPDEPSSNPVSGTGE